MSMDYAYHGRLIIRLLFKECFGTSYLEVDPQSEKDRKKLRVKIVM